MSISTRLVGGLAAAGLVAALASATGTPAGAEQPPTLSQSFAAAARAEGVPREVVAAVSWARTRWQAHPGEPSVAGGWGPMHLVDPALVDGRGEARPPAETSLDRAAHLTGLSRAALRSDVDANVRGGAALLADAQRRLHGPVGAGSDPAAWYAAVAAVSGSSDEGAATAFADDVFARLPGAPDRSGIARLGLRAAPTSSRVDCPRSLRCEWVPAPYEQTGDDPTAYGNHDLAHRPAAPSIRYIVVHDTEEPYAGALAGVTDPSYLAWNYTIRSSDGHVAQHLEPRDVGWHAGNWYVNMHSIGIEHEGYAAQGGSWYTEQMYRSSARLVRHLAREYRIPLDRAHVIGHDQVPALQASAVAGMHWDPGPYWDWEHYFDLLGAPLDRGTARHETGLVRIVPGFEGNAQVVTGCGDSACEPDAANFVPLRTGPSGDAPLVADRGLAPDAAAGTTDVADIGPRAAAGTTYAVAGRRGGWTAIWYLGAKAWFHDPAHRVGRSVRGAWVTPRQGRASVPVYGGAYPEASAYPAGTEPQAQQAITPYALGAGQRYAVVDAHPATDYYRAKTFSPDTPGDHVLVRGEERFLQVSFGHRTYFVKAADVVVHHAR